MSQRVEPLTPHVVKAAHRCAGTPMLEELVRLENAWRTAVEFAGDLRSIEDDTPNVSVKAAVNQALDHVLDATESIRRALVTVRVGGR